MYATTAISWLAALASVATAVPAPAPVSDAADSIVRSLNAAGYTVNAGHYDAGLNKRQNVPSECSFEGSRGSFDYFQITNGDFNTCCFGYATSTTSCGAGVWGDPDFTDIQSALGNLVVKDGQFESGEAGAWTATFFLGTTAYSNRNISPFALGLTQSTLKSVTLYFSLDGDFSTIARGSCP